MLDAQIIRWEHILWHLDASAHLPHDFFRHIFATIEEIMAEGAPELESKQLTKDAINSVLGLWSTPQRYVYNVETTMCSEDLLRTSNCRKRAAPGHGELYDYIFETQLKSFTSMRPIQQIVLDMELVYLSITIGPPVASASQVRLPR